MNKYRLIKDVPFVKTGTNLTLFAKHDTQANVLCFMVEGFPEGTYMNLPTNELLTWVEKVEE